MVLIMCINNEMRWKPGTKQKKTYQVKRGNAMKRIFNLHIPLFNNLLFLQCSNIIIKTLNDKFHKFYSFEYSIEVNVIYTIH